MTGGRLQLASGPIGWSSLTFVDTLIICKDMGVKRTSAEKLKLSLKMIAVLIETGK